MQQANRWTVKAGQETDHAACQQADSKGKQEMDHACSMPGNIQRHH
jgi:hypothetical protein